LSLWLALLAVLLIPSIIYWGIPGASGWFARFVPVSVEEQLGNYVVNELFPDRRICQADAGRKALDEMVMRLTTEESEYNFKVEVVDSDWVNAIAFPGGKILIFRGLLEKSPSADALAGVLAHEMQHILHRHGTENLLSQTALSGIFRLLSGEAGSLAKTLFDGVHILSILKYTRQFEREADESALMLLIKSGVDPAEMIKMYQVLSKYSSSFPEAISTHPDMSSRLERLKTLIQQEPEFESRNVIRETGWKSLQKICQS
jgi:predicted Zn-dependent protease